MSDNRPLLEWHDARGLDVTPIDPERLLLALAVHTAWPFGVGDDPERVRQVLDVYRWLADAGKGANGESLADLVAAWEGHVWESNLGNCRDLSEVAK